MVELLIYVFIASAVTAGVAGALVSMIRSDQNMEIRQRAMEAWGRISFLIESEVAEGNRILYGESIPCEGGGKSAFTIQIPVERPGTDAEPVATGSQQIHYYLLPANPPSALTPQTLLRCGPPYLANGALSDEPPLTAVISRRVRMTVDSNGGSASDASRSVRYTLNFLTGNGTRALGELGRSTVARTRVAEVSTP